MSVKSIVVTAGGTLACALGIGFMMEQSAKSRSAADTEHFMPVQTASLAPEVVRPDTVRSEQEITLTDISLTAASETVLPVARPRAAPGNTPVTPVDPVMPQLGCAIQTDTSVRDHAYVHIDISAPCYRNERVTIHHVGMQFTEVTDGAGKLSLDVPALSQQAVFILAFGNGQGAVAQAHVPTLSGYDRVVLQWGGTPGIQLHAREFGANYGDAGHAWSGRAQAEGGQTGGFVHRLGQAETLSPLLAEVYSFPRGGAQQTGTVEMTVETEVTHENCGMDVTAQTLRVMSGMAPQARDLVLSIPGCGAKGEFMVLNNLVDNLKIAVN